MQTVTAGFEAAVAAGVRTPTYVLELLESSGYNYPRGQTITASATTTKASPYGLFAAANLAEGLSAEPAKYAVCDQGALVDNEYRTSGLGRRYNMGWWTGTKSDEAGDFASPPMAQLDYSPVIRANRIRVTSSAAYGGVKRVNIHVKYEGESVYADVGYLDFAAGEYRKTLTVQSGTTPKTIASIRCYINSTLTAGDYGRILEVEPLLEWSVETGAPLSNYARQITIQKSCGQNKAMKPAVPAVGANTLRFTLARAAGVTPTRNQVIHVSMGYDAEDLSQGYFIVADAALRPEGYDVVAYSRLAMADNFPFPNTVYQNRKVSKSINQALTWLGMNAADINYHLGAGTDKVWPWYVVEQRSTGQALRDMAEQFLVAIYEDELGEMHVRNDYGASVFTITDDMLKSYSRGQMAEVNQVSIHYGTLSMGKRDLVVSDQGELEASTSTSYVFRMSRGPCVKTTSPSITAFVDAEGNDLTLPSIIDWAADAEALNMTVRNNTATAGTFAVELYGYPLARGEQEAVYTAKDQASILTKGVLGEDISIYANTLADAKLVGDGQLQYLRNAADGLVVVVNRLLSHLQLHDVVTLTSTRIGVDADYVLNNIQLEQASRRTSLELIPIGAY